MRYAATATLVLLGTPTVAAAADAEGVSVVWHAANLLLLLVVVAVAARKPLGRYLQERRSSIETNLASAADLLHQAEARLAEWQARADALASEEERIRRDARERAALERERILADAEASARRIRRDAELGVAQELQRAREALRAEAAELAVELAAELVSENITDADRERLVGEFVERVERGTAPSAGARG